MILHFLCLHTAWEGGGGNHTVDQNLLQKQVVVLSKGTIKRATKTATCFATLLQNKLKSDIAQSRLNLSCNKSGCYRLRKFVAESREQFYFCNKICTCCAFYRPKANLIATSDVTPVYGVSPAKFYPIKSQYSRNLQQPDLLRDRFDSWVVKRATSLFHSPGSNVAKQVARFCCPVGLNILWCSVTQSTSTYISYVQV